MSAIGSEQLTEIKDRVVDVINFGKTLIGIKYGWWKGGKIQTEAPMWAINEKVPKIKDVDTINCAGLTNLMLRYVDTELPHSPNGGTGGTMAYYEYYKTKGVTKKFDLDNKYPEGTLIGRKYKDVEDQGHVGVIIYKNEEQYVLQSIPNEGVNINFTKIEWKWVL